MCRASQASERASRYGAADGQVESVTVSEPPGDSPAPRHGRLLLVDDEPAVLSVCKELLVVLGYEVTAVADAHEALQLVAEGPERFDGVVTDQSMPKMTGVELAHAIWHIRPQLPIVLTTGYLEGDLLDRLGDPAVVRVIGKPYSLQELNEALDALTQTRSP
jgi:CheY-like chemotaxis protein